MPSTSHAAPAGRKKPFVIALSLSLFLSPLFLGLHFCQATAATASLLSLSSRFLSLSLSLSRCVFLGMRGWGVGWRCFLPSLKENGSSLPLSLFFNKAIFHHLHSMCKQNREYEKKKKKHRNFIAIPGQTTFADFCHVSTPDIVVTLATGRQSSTEERSWSGA